MRWQIALAVVCFHPGGCIIAVQQPPEPEVELAATPVVVESGACTMLVAFPVVFWRGIGWFTTISQPAISRRQSS